MESNVQAVIANDGMATEPDGLFPDSSDGSESTRQIVSYFECVSDDGGYGAQVKQ